MLENIRVSTGSASVLGLAHIAAETLPTTCYIMTFTQDNCLGNCAFCPQGQGADEKYAKQLSRIQWPKFSWDEFFDALQINQQGEKSARFKRVCLQVINYPAFFEDAVEIIGKIHSAFPNLNISSAIPPLSLEKLHILKEKGLERIGIALDACTPHLFDQIKAADPKSPYSWATHWTCLDNALSVFGKGFVTTHFIVGLGESEEDMLKAIYTALEKRILPGIFYFTPIKGTLLAKSKQAPLLVFRKIQLGRYLLMKNRRNFSRLEFTDGRLTGIQNFTASELSQIVDYGQAFKTAGCPDCNRPYYNSRPGDEQDGYPRDLFDFEKEKIYQELEFLISKVAIEKTANIWRCIPFQTATGAENMAIDEALMESVISGESPNIIRFYRWKPTTATIGRNQSLSAEIDLEAANSLGIEVVRRISGGGAVLHDSQGEITYSVICRLEDIPKIHLASREYRSDISGRYVAILEALAHGLESLGVPIDVGKIHCPALLTKGKKLSGNAQAIKNGVLLQHGTILLSVDPEIMYRVLKAPEGVPYTKMVQSVRSKVTGISPFLHEGQKRTDSGDDHIISALQQGFEHVFQIRLFPQDLSADEAQNVNKLIANRYANPAWLNKHP